MLDGVVEMIFEQLSLDTAATDWAAALRKLGHDFRELAHAHPHVVPLLVTRPLATPLGMRPPGILRHLEEVLALLTEAGFSGDDALHMYRTLFGFLYGHVLTELQEIVERPEETDHVLRLGLYRLPIDQFPACETSPRRGPARRAGRARPGTRHLAQRPRFPIRRTAACGRFAINHHERR
ncbi:hypothetical protein MAUB1S_03531 [Mycolicibacterium aubagnense]